MPRDILTVGHIPHPSRYPSPPLLLVEGYSSHLWDVTTTFDTLSSDISYTRAIFSSFLQLSLSSSLLVWPVVLRSWQTW